MKRKLLATFFIFALMTMMLGGCGGSGQSSSSDDNSGTVQEETTQETGTQTIEISPEYVVVDDEYLKMTVTSISFTDDEWWGTYRVNYTVENKTDSYDIWTEVASGDCSVGPYTVEFSNENSTTKPGKINDTGSFLCSLCHDDEQFSSKGIEHVTSLEDLMEFEATVEITVYEDKGDHNERIERYNVPLSISNH